MNTNRKIDRDLGSQLIKKVAQKEFNRAASVQRKGDLDEYVDYRHQDL